ncbi:aldehyde dehydrogenase family protein [Ruixingdingia sedimenti]|uniref:Aldehyde dehydrogenase family protein n=1 Tax=Ruixingdingia sedimenti TaxID=3073604 RepID=A0ABU1F941_9RHOB|nr:aldehyde dehydrogenase family protein [Xinfangfangia sp. LG-4]MDR5653400.1 aldehyde dehydrogenase family protein [Xinfangfangia sp. LG-4]
MGDRLQHYVDGAWRDPLAPVLLAVENPADGSVAGRIALGAAADVDRAVAAARAAFPAWAATTPDERIAHLARITGELQARLPDLAATIMREMGAPITFARQVQADTAIGHLRQAMATLRDFRFEEPGDGYGVVYEPVGVAGFITAWNWPINLIMTKLAYGLAAGCTVVLKPSEIAPLSACILADAIHAAGLPAGVFNLVQGDGAGVGAAISAHPGIDLVSFTGSTRAGVQVAKAAADTVKRVHQELGGKSANIILPDADLPRVVETGVRRAFANSGQSCQAPTRMLVHVDQVDQVVAIAARVAGAIRVGDPALQDTEMGPVVSAAQYDRVQAMIRSGLDAGARIAAGGPGKPAGLEHGHYVRPTIFHGVTPDMEIAQEEIFGPVLPIIAYRDEDEAVEIANGTRYGLSSYIQSADAARAMRLARRMRAGRAYVNTVQHHLGAPFGGYKQSGNGREQGPHGLAEFLEIKAIITAG